MHKVLKYVYLKGKKVKRLDYTLYALNRLVKDTVYKKGKSQPAMPNPPSEEIEMIQNVSNTMTTDSPKENYGEQLRNQILSTLLPICQEITDQEVFKAMDSHIKKAVAIGNASKTFRASTSRLPVDVTTITEPANKVCIKQEKLYSTKRKRAGNGPVLKKPSAKVRREIGESLEKYELDVSIPLVSGGSVEYEHDY